MSFTSRGVIKRIEGAQGSPATASQWRAVKYVGRIQRGEERPIPGWKWPAAARRPSGANRVITGLERIARGQTKSLVRRNPAKRTTTTTTTTKTVKVNPRRRRNSRRAIPMARKKRSRTPAQKAAFRRMLAGLARHKAKKGGRARRAAAPAVVVVSNPRRRKARKNPSRKRRRNPTRGVVTMARRRHSRAVARKNPHRKHRRKNPHHRRHRRQNPGGAMAIVKSTIATAIPAIAAGGVMALLDNKLLGDKAMPVQVIGKLAAAAGVGLILRKNPRTAAVAMGAMLGSLGYQLAAKLGGGVVATNTTDAAKQLSALVRADGRMAALVNGDGSLRTMPSLSGMGDMGGTAIPTQPIYDTVTLG